MMDKNTSIEQLLSFLHGKKYMNRQEFIIKNLKVSWTWLKQYKIKDSSTMIKKDILSTIILTFVAFRLPFLIIMIIRNAELW
jgi:hypothetical protein